MEVTKEQYGAKALRGGGIQPLVQTNKEAEMNTGKKPVIIAGNGPSLARIDYTRLPQDFDVYRCNQFYFEDKYYLGKRVSSVFFNPAVFFQQYHTLKKLLIRKEYECEEIFSSKMLWGTEDLKVGECFNMIYPDAIEIYKIVQQYPKVHAFLKYNDLFLKQRATSGILMLLIAAIRGYKEMHLIGIDFYENGDYAFELRKENLLRLMPDFSNCVKTCHHTKSFDMECIAFIQEYFDLKLYDLSLGSHALNLPKSPMANNSFVLKDKPQDSIKDIVMPEVDNPLPHYNADKMDSMQDVYTKMREIYMKMQEIYSAIQDVHKRTQLNTFRRWYLDIKRIFRAIWQAIAR